VPLGSRAGRLPHRARRAKHGRPKPLFSRGLPRRNARPAHFLPGNAFGKLPRTVRRPDPSGRSVTFKLNQLSLACPVKRAQPPWTVDDTALIPSLTTSQLTTGRSVRIESDTYAAPIVRTTPTMIPKNMRIQAPFCPERFPQDSERFPQDSGHTLAFVFTSGQPRRVISLREVKIEQHFTASRTDERRGVGQHVRERKRHCRVHPSAGCARSGNESWNSFARTGGPGKGNA